MCYQLVKTFFLAATDFFVKRLVGQYHDKTENSGDCHMLNEIMQSPTGLYCM